MKNISLLIIILFNALSIFAQQDTSITVRSYTTQGKTYTTRDTAITVRGYKIQGQRNLFKRDSIVIGKKQAFDYKRDSMKIVRDFFIADSNRIFKIYSDNGFNNYDTLSKEITTEVTCNPDATIFIENLNRKLIIKTSPDNKVRMTTTVNYSVDPKISDEAWFQTLNLQLKSNNNQVVLKSDNTRADNSLRTITITRQSSVSSTNTLQHYDLNNVSNPTSPGVFGGNGNVFRIGKITNTLTVYIPANAKLDVESKYADVEIQNDLKSIKADITNASLRFMNVENIDIQGKYARINAGNIKKADIELNNGKFYAKDIYSAKFDSKYSNIEFGVSNDLKIESNNDQYEIDEVTDLKANKNYGNIRITNLKNSFTLTGNNADIKIRDIAAGVSNIKIDDKYADIRLPVNNIVNYMVDFDGKNCNVYAPFEKIPVIKIEEVKPKDSQLKEPPPAKEAPTKKLDEIRITGFKALSPLTMTRNGVMMDAKDNAFKATVGDVKGKHAELQLKCTNCTVDFK